MKIDPATRTLTLERKPCGLCRGSGRSIVAQPCPTGGRGPRGGKDGCRTCHGTGSHYDRAVTETCRQCGGNDPLSHEAETVYDHLGFGEFRSLVEWKVVDATDTRFTELGMCLAPHGALYTCGDYGAHLDLDDDALIAAVKDRDDWTQAVKLVDGETLRLCDAIAIVRRRNGYTVAPVWNDGE